MSTNNVDKNKQTKHHFPGVEEYLWANTEKISAERNAKKIEELEKEKYKDLFIAKYQKAVSETQDRFIQETKFCSEVHKLIIPALEEIIDFAKRKSIFPPETNRIPDLLPIQLFDELKIPTIEKNLSTYYLSKNNEIVTEYEKKVAELMQKHVYLICGINWGWISGNTGDGDFYGSIYGIQLSISHLGEVKLDDSLFNTSELLSREFMKALSDVFYSPIIINNFYKKPNLSKSTFTENVKNYWKILWNEPQFEINDKTPLLKKIWYGFPKKHKSK